MNIRSLLIRLLAGAICFALVGCSEESAVSSPQASATPNASQQASSAEKRPGPEGEDISGHSSSSRSSNKNRDNRPEHTLTVDEDDRTAMTEMSVEPGKERYFQNGLNPAEIEYRRKRNETKAKARLEAAERRKDRLNSGNDAPVFDVGGGELTTVNVGAGEG